jgi:hypothetical protein
MFRNPSLPVEARYLPETSIEADLAEQSVWPGLQLNDFLVSVL